VNENLDLFTKSAFAEASVIDGVEVWGIFDENYQELFGSDYSNATSLSAEGRHFSFCVQTAQIAHVHHGAIAIIRDRNFKVTGIQPIDDGAMTDLILKEY
jgi:hypothetical protein